MTTLRDDVYPDLVIYFYTNAYREYGEVFIKSYVKGVSFTFDRFVIKKIIGLGLGLGLGREVYRDNISRKEQLKVLYGHEMDE